MWKNQSKQYFIVIVKKKRLLERFWMWHALCLCTHRSLPFTYARRASLASLHLYSFDNIHQLQPSATTAQINALFTSLIKL